MAQVADGRPGLSERHLADACRSARCRAEPASPGTACSSSKPMPGRISRVTSAGPRSRSPAGRSMIGTMAAHYCPPSTLFRGHDHGSRTRDRATSRAPKLLALLGDSVTTDHISPAGSIAKDRAPLATYLHGTADPLPQDFNSYGSRRGNHEVMMRGTFANIRLQQRTCSRHGRRLDPDDPEQRDDMAIYDAAMAYQEKGVPLLVIFGGKEYGTGSSRDWAAKGTNLSRRQSSRSQKASSVFTAPIWSAWACCRWCSRMA